MSSSSRMTASAVVGGLVLLGFPSLTRAQSPSQVRPVAHVASIAAGHQLQSGQAVPLASFPEGDYRLEIKITDKIANKILTREIVFTVIPS